MPAVALIAAALIILLKMWQGWRLGLVRQLVSMAALLVSAGVGTLGASAAATVLHAVLPFPERALVPIGGLLLGLAVFAGITVTGAILFKKTGDQGVTLVRVGYGIAGAALGAVYGVILVCAFGMGLRLLGSVAETTLALEKNPQLTGRRPPAAGAFASGLIALRRDVEQSPAGRLLRWVDPIPETTYSTLAKLSALVATPKAIERFLNEPGVRPVMRHPKVAALLSDPEVPRAISERRYFALLSNPKLVAAADDPEVLARVRAIDLGQALDHALRRPEGR